VVLVDDWLADWVDVERGTMDAVTALGYKVHLHVKIGLVNTNSFHTGGDTFWNGCGVFVLERVDI
jgi:hypothetical protein